MLFWRSPASPFSPPSWRHARTLLQIPLFAVAVLMVAHGLFGPQLAPKNLATTLTWVHFRGALVLTLLLAGNFFCMACPFMLPRDLGRKAGAERAAGAVTVLPQGFIPRQPDLPAGFPPLTPPVASFSRTAAGG